MKSTLSFNLCLVLAFLAIAADRTEAKGCRSKAKCCRSASCNDCCGAVVANPCNPCGGCCGAYVSGSCGGCGETSYPAGETIVSPPAKAGEGDSVLEKPTEEPDPDSPFLTRRQNGRISPESAITGERIANSLRSSAQTGPMSLASMHVSTNSPRKQDLETAKLYFSLVYRLYWAGQYDRAIQVADKGLASADEEPRIWYYKGLSQIALGDHEAGTRSLGFGVRADSQHPEYRGLVGHALRRVQGDLRIQIESARLLVEQADIPSIDSTRVAMATP